jgi:hypothetical protein
VGHHEPPEVTPADRELDEGALADEEPWPDWELVPDELVPDEEPWPDELPDVAPDDDPVLVLADVPAELAVACVVPGRANASPPAAASPRAAVPAVAARSRLRARSRRTTAGPVRGSLLFIHCSFTEVNTPRLPQRPVAEVPASSAAALNDWAAHQPGGGLLVLRRGDGRRVGPQHPAGDVFSSHAPAT